MLEILNKLADELFAEFGFATCSEHQQEIILQEFVDRGMYLISMND